jgi:hypothetical protein
LSIAGPLDLEVRRFVYDGAIARGVPPSAQQAAAELGVAVEQVRAAFERLAAEHVLVLDRDTREISMAMPFAAFPTPFPTRVAGTTYHGNCAWDALGIAAMLRQDARIDASCGCCSFPMSLRVTAGGLEPAPGVVHFAVPARRFWDNIVFT